MQPPRLGRSLSSRVALASAMAAAIGGTAAALSMGVTAKELVTKQENKSLKAAARALAREVMDELDDDGDGHRKGRARLLSIDDPDHKKLELALNHELEDVKLPGARAVVRDRERVILGDPRLPTPSFGDCELVTYDNQEARGCTVAMGLYALTLVADADAERDRNVLIGRALIVGLLCGALLGGLASFVIARWALSPLTTLRDRVRGLRVDDARPEQLGPPARQIELEELRAAIAQLVERLSAALHQAKAFAAEAAHELRTPLTTIGGELELLAEVAREADRPALTRVQGQVTGLTALVQRLLVLAQPSRLEAEQTELVDLSDVTQAAFDGLATDAAARVETQVADDVVVRGDATLLRALVINALDNALKFSSGRVQLVIAQHDAQARIDVIDDGPGVPPEERARVFTPFYRSPEVRADGASGHGIGLSLIARVAWRHGGSAFFIDAEKGAHLRVSLPAWRAKV